MAGGAEAGIGKALAELHGGLVERVDVHKPAGKHGRGHEQPHDFACGAHGGFRRFQAGERHAVMHEGRSRAEGFGVEQVPESLAPQPFPAVRHVVRELRALAQVRAVQLDAALVGGAVEEHLLERVLIGNAHCGQRHGPLAVFAEAFRPELAEPLAERGP